MLEQLFGSKTRVRLLMLMLNNSSQPFYLREISRQIGVQLNSVRREVINLEKNQVLKAIEIKENTTDEKNTTKNRTRRNIRKYKKYYLINTESVIFPELKAMFLKAKLLLEKNLVNEIEKIAHIYYLVLTGTFVGLDGFSTDLLLVGKVNKKNISKIIRRFEKDLNRQINYTVMTLPEFKYRQDITDKFLYDILEGKKIVVIDKLIHSQT